MKESCNVYEFEDVMVSYRVSIENLMILKLNKMESSMTNLKKNVIKSDLPFGSEFSPSQISLKRVLEIAKTHDGDWKAFEHSIYEEYFKSNKTSENNKRKLANNTKLGMQAYGILDQAGNLTKFGNHLLSLTDNHEVLYTEFARHILLNLYGFTLVQCVLDIQSSGEKVDLIILRTWLEDRGIHVPRGGKHPSIMRLWLEKAGVLNLDGK